MPDAYEERFRQHEEILRSLTAMLVKQDSINERLTRAIERIDHTLAQQVEINADVRTTLARMETLFARLFRSEGNGRDA
jgi:predicted RNase H-like nuclease (RuvC/YqgF family)